MIDECLLTTLDNPYDPFTQNESWSLFDLQHGYASNQWLAKYTYASQKMEEEDFRQEVSDGIDRFLAINPFGIHYKLFKKQAKTMIPLANKVYKQIYGSVKQKDS